MAVEEVSCCYTPQLTKQLLTYMQEFSIEIPDAEADEIKTVAQGTLSFVLAVAYPHALSV